MFNFRDQELVWIKASYYLGHSWYWILSAWLSIAKIVCYSCLSAVRVSKKQKKEQKQTGVKEESLYLTQQKRAITQVFGYYVSLLFQQH